jgi:hypothetical protein
MTSLVNHMLMITFKTFFVYGVGVAINICAMLMQEKTFSKVQYIHMVNEEYVLKFRHRLLSDLYRWGAHHKGFPCFPLF